MIRATLAALAALFVSNAALADINFCNRTNSRLQYVVALPVTSPYVTNEIAGWFLINPGACKQIAWGDMTGDLLHYYVSYADSNRRWVQDDSLVYQFCVSYSKFVRRGTWNELQFNCPTGWAKLDFYRVVVPAREYRLNFTD